MKICIDAGHGGDDPGCRGNGRNEKDLNLEYAFKLKDYLERYKNVQIFMTRSTDEAFSLTERANNANVNKCDLFISCHLNAFNREARGTEIIHSIYATQHFMDLCTVLGNNLAKNLGIPMRRVFSKRGANGDYYGVIRQTIMPAMIIEALFLDNCEDYKHYNSDKIAKSITADLANHYGLQLKIDKPVPAKSSDVIYKVQVGAYKDKKNAENQIKDLKSKGIDGIIIKN
jgi:N-acetylmuramoyl-L-alanine amidase